MSSATSKSSGRRFCPSNRNETKPIRESAEISKKRSSHQRFLKPDLVGLVQGCNRPRLRGRMEGQLRRTIVLQRSYTEALRAQISEKPHKCPECPRSFNRSDHVRAHMRNQHSTLAFSVGETHCKKCDKRFPKLKDFVKHECLPNARRYALLRCQTSLLTYFPTARPYYCQPCNQDLASSPSFSRYLKTEKHRQVTNRAINEELSLVSEENVSFCQGTIEAWQLIILSVSAGRINLGIFCHSSRCPNPIKLVRIYGRPGCFVSTNR